MESTRDERPRFFATLDAGLIAWLWMCDVKPSRYRTSGVGDKQRIEAVFEKTEAFVLARDLYHRTCLFGRAPGSEDIADDQPAPLPPDVKPRGLVERYRDVLSDLRRMTRGEEPKHIGVST